MRNPLRRTWRTLAAREELVMAGSQRTVVLTYRNPTTGEEVHWTVPVPASPDMPRAIERAFERKGFVRVEDEPPS